MTVPSIKLLVNVLRHPECLPDLTMQEWDLLVRQARHADMMARIADDCTVRGLMERIPAQPRRHLESAAILLQRQHQELRWEVDQIAQALAPAGVELVLLKGASYVMGKRLASQGRMMSDVDILVSRANLSQVESALMMRGWMSSTQTAYDQHYYRTWMHELPPMRHVHRGSVIDVHHAIVPLSSRSHPDTQLLLAAAVPVQAGNCVKTLGPVDMVIHSATHLFHEGEFEQGFRGLVDIDALLREFSPQKDFWEKLVPRAKELELVRPLFYALRYCQKVLGTPLPVVVRSEIGQSAGAPKSSLLLMWMDSLFMRALLPNHPTISDKFTPTARFLLYLRGHWLRMPPGLLAIHLMRKMLARRPTPVKDPQQVL